MRTLRIPYLAPIIALGFLAMSPNSSHAIEKIYTKDLHASPEDTLRFTGNGAIAPGTKLKAFVLGGWPEHAETPRPTPETNLSVLRGQQENFEWANAFLLRVDPANFSWLKNASLAGVDAKLNMGRDPILISFEEPICAIGLKYAQGGAHNPHHPELRKRTSISFYDYSGVLIGRFDEKPGYFTNEAAFQKQALEPEIFAFQISSEVPFAIIWIVAQPCAVAVG